MHMNEITSVLVCVLPIILIIYIDRMLFGYAEVKLTAQCIEENHVTILELRTENLGVHLLCCCPRTDYEHLWTSVINCMGYREYGKWIYKSPSDQCKVMSGLAVSNNGVALDNMLLSFLLYKLM